MRRSPDAITYTVTVVLCTLLFRYQTLNRIRIGNQQFSAGCYRHFTGNFTAHDIIIDSCGGFNTPPLVSRLLIFFIFFTEYT
ncbi:MAG TPA: hypothetical protein DCL73_10300 [Treponema sp.]|nr:hypothetical protein [Treponema sp.]